MKELVIYHAGCWDGFCAAWLFRKVFPDAGFHAAHYGTPLPDCTGKRVFIADFSYKRPVMRQILSQAHAVTVLDHHATAEAELAGLCDEFTMRPDLIANPPGVELPLIHFDMGKSGGRLTWEYLAARYPASLPDTCPWLVDYTEDRDLWRHALPESRAVNAALRSYPLDFGQWDWLADRNPLWFAREGEAILRAEKQVISAHVRNAREIELGGHRVLCCNATTLFSEIAGELAQDRPFGACYFDRSDRVRQWSLRSRDGGVDVSQIAASLGGGGHRNAAGFQEELPS